MGLSHSEGAGRTLNADPEIQGLLRGIRETGQERRGCRHITIADTLLREVRSHRPGGKGLAYERLIN
jgi:hypothetical protein